MKDHGHDAISAEETTRRIWAIAQDIKVCMFTTWNGEAQRSRPMHARFDDATGAVYFLTDEVGDLNTEIAAFPTVSLAWADNGAYKYAVVSGQAALSNDRAKIAALFSPVDKAWWDDANDPSIRLITVTPEHGEVWDSPGRIVAGAKMLVAALTGGKPDMGVNAEVKL